LVLEGAVIPKGFALITYSVTGKLAYLNPIGFLAVRRSPNNTLQLINGLPSIDQLNVVLEAERDDVPENVHFTEVISQPSPQPVPDFGVSIAYRPQPAVGIGNLSYECSTIDRYPRIDIKGSELPATELPMFGFPHGLHLHFGSRQRYPLPQFFTFVFTNIKGEHFYAECLRFYERVCRDQLNSLVSSLYGYRISEEDGDHVSFLIGWLTSILINVIMVDRLSSFLMATTCSVPKSFASSRDDLSIGTLTLMSFRHGISFMMV
jgi:hypothetical protein